MPLGMSLTNLIIFGGIGIGVFGFIAVVLGRYMNGGEEEKDFEPKRIETMIEPELRELGSFYGRSINAPLRYDYSKIGKAYKQLSRTGNVNRDDENIDEPEDRIDEEELEDAVENGEVSEKVANSLKNFGEEDVTVFFVRSDNKVLGVPMDKIVFKFWKLFGKENAVSKIVVVPDRLLRSDNEYLTIKKQAEMTRFAGMDVAKEPSSYRFIENIAYRQLYSQALEDQKNYHDKVNFYDSNFSQSIQEIKAEAQAEQSKWKGKGSGMVNEED